MRKEITYDYKNPLIQDKTQEEITEITESILTKIDSKEELTDNEMHFFHRKIGKIHEKKERTYGQWDNEVHMIKELYRDGYIGKQYYEVMYIYVNRTYSHEYDYKYVKPVYPVEFQTVVTYREWKFKN